MDLIKIIRDNKFFYLNLEKLTEKLAELLNQTKNSIREQLTALIACGDLFLENDKISISADRGYYKAKITLNKKGFGFAVVEGFNDFFIPAFAINGAFDGDDCLVEITDMKSPDDIEGKVVHILKRNTTHVVGTYIEGKSKNVVFPDDVRLPQIRIFKKDAGRAKNNDKVWVELDLTTLDQPVISGKIIEVLGHANTPKADQISIIREHC